MAAVIFKVSRPKTSSLYHLKQPGAYRAVHPADDGKLATRRVVVYEGERPVMVAETHPNYRPEMIDYISRDREGKNENCVQAEGVEVKTHTGRARFKLARGPHVRLHLIVVENRVTDVLRKFRGGSNMGMMI
jgi:hypothetical protein